MSTRKFSTRKMSTNRKEKKMGTKMRTEEKCVEEYECRKNNLELK